jgi:hypothetical protein
MSESVAQHDLEAMAAELAKRRKRLFTLNILILFIPLAMAVIFFLFGRDDRTWVRDKVVKTVGEIVPPKVEQTVPPKVLEVLHASKVEERLTALEAKLARPAPVTEPSAKNEEGEAKAGTPIDAAVIKKLLDQVNNLETLKPRLKEAEESLKNLEQPDGIRKAPALWTNLGVQEEQLKNQKALLDDHRQRIQALEGLKIPADLNTTVANIPELSQNLKDLDRRLQELSGVEQKIKTLRTDLGGKIDQDIKKLNTEWERVRKEERTEAEKRFTSVAGRIDTVEKSAFRSTLTRERDTITIPSLNFLVKTESFQNNDTLAKLTIQPPGEPPIPLPVPVSLDQPISFKYKGCNYELMVRRVTNFPVPRFRDYMEILLGRQCPIPGAGS